MRITRHGKVIYEMSYRKFFIIRMIASVILLLFIVLHLIGVL